MPHLTITEAIGRLRDLHDAGYDLRALLSVALQHDFELAMVGGDLAMTAHRYREQLAAECGAPTFDEFQRKWPRCSGADAARTAFAWQQLAPMDRIAAIAGIDAFLTCLADQGRSAIPSGALYLSKHAPRRLTQEASN